MRSNYGVRPTVEEARILAMGGEEIQVNNNDDTTAAEMDEATGLTGWSTVTIRRTTVHQQAREERAQQRLKERQAKRADGIRMRRLRQHLRVHNGRKVGASRRLCITWSIQTTK